MTEASQPPSSPLVLLEGTPESRILCQEVSARCGGVCLLGFSRGKDSLCAFLWLRHFFHRIIPFHTSVIPHLSFVDESLDYYESVFDTPIERCRSGELGKALDRLWFQPYEARETIDQMNLWIYNNNEVAGLLREKYNVPRAWCAYGVSLHDSIFRRARLHKRGRQAAYHEGAQTFYPCFDWQIHQIKDAIRISGVKLPRDYLLACRTLDGTPTNRLLDRMADLMPEDYARIQEMFPLIDVVRARNEFRKLKKARERQSAGVSQS